MAALLGFGAGLRDIPWWRCGFSIAKSASTAASGVPRIAACFACCHAWWLCCGGGWPIPPSLPGDDALSMRIAEHAGAGILTGVSSHLLVATHVYLEMLHYGVWLVMIPLVSLRTMPWQIDQVPLARRSRSWRRLVVLALGPARWLCSVFGPAFWPTTPPRATSISPWQWCMCWPKYRFCCGCCRLHHESKRAVVVLSVGLSGDGTRAALRYTPLPRLPGKSSRTRTSPCAARYPSDVA